MTCVDVKKCQLFLDKELNSPSSADFEGHVQVCPVCGRLLQCQRDFQAFLQHVYAEPKCPQALKNQLAKRLWGRRKRRLFMPISNGRFAHARAIVAKLRFPGG